MTLKATACSVWPLGKLNSSSGRVHSRTPAQARAGRGRAIQRLTMK